MGQDRKALSYNQSKCIDMKCVLFCWFLVPVLTNGQDSQRQALKEMYGLLDEVSTGVLSVDPDFHRFREFSYTIEYLTDVHPDTWSEFSSAIATIKIDSTLVVLKETIPHEYAAEMGKPPCFSDWYYSELILGVQLYGAIIRDDTHRIASVVARSAINRAKYNGCASNY